MTRITCLSQRFERELCFEGLYGIYFAKKSIGKSKVTSHEDILIYHVKEKLPELEQAPVIGELFQLHAIMAKSSMIGFPGIPGTQDHDAKEAQAGTPYGNTYHALSPQVCGNHI